MAYKPLYDQAYVKTLISQINKLNKRKTARRRSEQRASDTPSLKFSQSQKAAAVILKSIRAKKKGENGARD